MSDDVERWLNEPVRNDVRQEVTFAPETLDQMRTFMPEQRRLEALRYATAVAVAPDVVYECHPEEFILRLAPKFVRYLETGETEFGDDK